MITASYHRGQCARSLADHETKHSSPDPTVEPHNPRSLDDDYMFRQRQALTGRSDSTTTNPTRLTSTITKTCPRYIEIPGIVDPRSLPLSQVRLTMNSMPVAEKKAQFCDKATRSTIIQAVNYLILSYFMEVIESDNATFVE